MKLQAIKIHPADNVAVAIEDISANTSVEVDGFAVVTREQIRRGHKFALQPLQDGDKILKYGHIIGHATERVEPGAWVHVHNVKTDLSERDEYQYEPVRFPTEPNGAVMPTFLGYRRANGKVGTRNEIWIVNTVGCVNITSERIAKLAAEQFVGGTVEGVHAFTHPFGCSQLGDDLQYTQRVLTGLMRHPNAGGVLVLGLGCENNQMEYLLNAAGDVDRSRIRFFNAQDVEDEIDSGLASMAELAEIMSQDRRTECPASELVLGMKCGGSDGFSGISANPLVGRISDRITSYGGTAVLTEVPEMFGAERQLMNRAQDEKIFQQIVDMINDFKQYFVRYGQPVYENPSPGNKDGGITTLEEKSLGATQKGGRATVVQVLDYAEPVRKGGLALLKAPGNDAVSCTAMVASGATVILFTTGRGTPLGVPIPTLKISTNTPLYEKKPRWIDFNAGALLDGAATMDELADALFDKVLRTASGEKTNNELNGYREIAIWKDGVTL